MRSRFQVFVGVFLFLVFSDSISLRGQRSADQPSTALCESQKDLGEMCLGAVSQEPLGSRIPVILIHGWNSKKIPGPPDLTVWSGLVYYLQQLRWFNGKYKLYYVSYYSNIQSIRDMGLIFIDLLDRMDLSDPAFQKKPLIIIGYSMGGLIARSFMQEPRFGSAGPGGNRVLRLITLGTPHHGSPFANGPARDEKAGKLITFLRQFVDGCLFGFGIRWYMDNRFDLHWDNYDGLLDYERYFENNLWLERLNADSSFNKKITAYGGVVTPLASINDCLTADSGCLAAVMKGALGVELSDGVVPYDSALFSPCIGCASLRGFLNYNHSEMVRGKSDNDPLFQYIADDLFGALLVGRWFVRVSGHTIYDRIPITWIELRLYQPLSGRNPSLLSVPLSASWRDSAGCRAGIGAENPYLLGWVNHSSSTISVGVEHLLCNYDSDFYLDGSADKEIRVITGRCSGGPNCRFIMTRR